MPDTKSIINLDEWEFEFQQRDRHPVMMADQWCKSLYQHYAEEIKFDIPRLDYMFTGTNRGYNKIQQKQEMLDKLFQAIEDQEYLDFIFARAMKLTNRMVDFSQSLEIESLIDNKKLLVKWQEFNKLFLQAIPWFFIPYYLSEKDVLTGKVKTGLLNYQKQINEITDFNSALALLCFPIKENKIQQSQAELYKLVKFAAANQNYASDPDFEKILQEYLVKFAWTKTFIMLPIEPMDNSELLEKVTESLSSSFIEEYELQLKKKEENKEIIEKIYDLIKSDEQMVKDITNARHLGWLLNASVEDLLEAMAGLQPMFKKIAKAIAVDYQDWVNLNIDEVEDLLKGKEVKFDMSERNLSYIYIMENGERQVYYGAEAKKMSEEIDTQLNQVETNVTEFKGQPTSPGKVKGRVKVTPTPTESKHLKEGEILVCAMTSPDYVPAMKRAAAIVTDEGGLLSHAAIISRELGKPCIVGTKIATQVLKDGDEVEVDADEGVVRIINK